MIVSQHSHRGVEGNHKSNEASFVLHEMSAQA